MISFRVKSVVVDFLLPDDIELLRFDDGDRLRPTVSLRSAAQSENTVDARYPIAYVEAKMSAEPKQAELEILISLADDRLPKDIQLPDTCYENLGIGRNGSLNGLVPEPSWFPAAFQRYADSVERELDIAVTRTVSALRWRLRASGPPRPFTEPVFEFSVDEDAWHSMPGVRTVWLDAVSSAPFRQHVIDDVKNTIRAGASEPLGHELLREAMALCWVNPRSSVLVGMAALEVGIKECIMDLMPGTAWLATHVQSPPTVQMLNEYLPTLPVRLPPGGSIGRPTKTTNKLLNEWTKVRNRLAHTGECEIQRANLQILLWRVRDILYLLDYHRGQSWALDYVQDDRP